MKVPTVPTGDRVGVEGARELLPREVDELQAANISVQSNATIQLIVRCFMMHLPHRLRLGYLAPLGHEACAREVCLILRDTRQGQPVSAPVHSPVQSRDLSNLIC